MWAVAKFALSGLLGPAWLGKLIAVGAGALALVSTYLVWHHKVYAKGWNDHVQAIATENQAAIEESRRVRSTVRSCLDSGLQYEQNTGKCVRR